MSSLFTVIFYQPILNLLVFIYDHIPGNDLGISIIIVTIIIKLILLPLSKQSIKSQKAMQDLQPKLDDIKKKHADNKEEMSKAMLQLYRDNKVNPFSSCFPLLIQLPFLFAVFKVFKVGLQSDLGLVYSFISKPEVINYLSLGFIELSKPNIALAILAGAAQFWQTKMIMSKRPEIKSKETQDENMMAIMNKQMMYMMPAMTVFIGLSLPGGLALYWLVTTLLTVLQQWYVFKEKNKDILNKTA